MNDSSGWIRLWQLLLLIFVLGIVIVLLMPARDSVDEPPDAVPKIEPAVPDSNDVQLSVVDHAEFDALLAKRRGDVVLVDFWALWCLPCVENFPHVIELANRHSNAGLAVVTVNMDSPEAAEITLRFLQEHRAGAATNVISQHGGGSKSMEAFEIPGGSLPCYKLYDRQGLLRQTFTSDPAAEHQFTLQDMDSTVEKLLGE